MILAHDKNEDRYGNYSGDPQGFFDSMAGMLTVSVAVLIVVIVAYLFWSKVMKKRDDQAVEDAE